MNANGDDDDSVDRVFIRAIETVRKIPQYAGYPSAGKPSIEERLELYSLFKQATEGDLGNMMARPDITDASARAKWDAWNRKAGMSRTQAKRQYISVLITTMNRYAATTSESRELIAELEYMWNQIADSNKDIPENEAKSNGSSSPAMRPMEYLQPRHQRSFTSTPMPLDQQQRIEQYEMQRWKRDIERAMEQMKVEIMALQEDLAESNHTDSISGHRRRKRLSMVPRFLTFFVKHLLFDIAILSILVLLSQKQEKLRKWRRKVVSHILASSILTNLSIR